MGEMRLNKRFLLVTSFSLFTLAFALETYRTWLYNNCHNFCVFDVIVETNL